LRGVQETSAADKVTFKSIFPAAYDGCWPHIYFEIFSSLASAATGTKKLRTSQLALPEAECKRVFATAGDELSVGNLGKTSIAKDMVFSDGYASQLPIISGCPAPGYVIDLVMGAAV
jgi:protocatechuate 3,4-dioxygenase beta subunit